MDLFHAQGAGNVCYITPPLRGGVHFVLYHALPIPRISNLKSRDRGAGNLCYITPPHPIPRISNFKSRDRGREFSAISRPPIPTIQNPKSRVLNITNLSKDSHLLTTWRSSSIPGIVTQLSQDDTPFP